MLGHRCKSGEAKNLPTSDDEHIYSADTCAVAHDVRLTLLQRFFKDVGDSEKQHYSWCLKKNPKKTLGGVWISFCAEGKKNSPLEHALVPPTHMKITRCWTAVRNVDELYIERDLFFFLFNAAELLPAVGVNRLGRGRLRADLRAHFAYRLPQVIYGVSEGKVKMLVLIM